MQLDHTHVKIRARSFTEIGDLSLVLLRRYPRPLFLCILLGSFPWLVINTALLAWMPWADIADGIIDEETVYSRVRCTWLMCILVFLQAPLAGQFLTYYIGQAIFEQQPSWTKVLRACRDLFWPYLWVHGVLRGPLLAIAILATNWGGPFAIGREFLGMFVILSIAIGFRAVRPYLPEIMLLEQCPLRSNKKGLSSRQRSGMLHEPISAEVVGRFMVSALLNTILVVSLLYSMIFVRGLLTGQWSWTFHVVGTQFPDVQLIWLPFALWSVVGLSTIVRFLCYLDARIRLEGWEVELKVRAEAIRQFGDESSINMASVGSEAAT